MEEERNVVQLNNKLGLLAKRKQLDEAKDLFNEMKEQNIVNTHTCANMINAFVRCGDTAGAEQIFFEMKQMGCKKNIVVFTTMIKGYCADGQLSKSLTLLDQMSMYNPPLVPNVRTINTVLRGCIQTGDVSVAESLVSRAQKEYKLALDVSSWEYLVSLLAQSLQTQKISPITGRLKGDTTMSSGMAAIYLNLARGAMVLGDVKAGLKALTSCESSLSNTAEETKKGQSGKEGEGDVEGKDKLTTGGKQGWRAEGAERERSLLVYQQHVGAETTVQVALLKAHFLALRERGVATREYLESVVLPLYSRFFCFPPLSSSGALVRSELTWAADGKKRGKRRKQTGKSADSEALSQTLFRQLERAGLPRLVSRLKECDGDTENSSPGCFSLESIRSTLASAVDSEGFLRLSALFPQTEDKTGGMRRRRKMEVCSGSGEWVVAQARADVGSDWIGLELRRDRAFHILQHAVLQSVPAPHKKGVVKAQKAEKGDKKSDKPMKGGKEDSSKVDPVLTPVDNLAVMCGDALQILPRHVCPESIDVMCVNHPEPPQQSGLDSAGTEGGTSVEGSAEISQGKHLLNEDFFFEVERVLRPGGICTVVTDNLWFGRALTRSLAVLLSGGSRSGQKLGLSSVREEAEGWVEPGNPLYPQEGSKWEVKFEYSHSSPVVGEDKGGKGKKRRRDEGGKNDKRAVWLLVGQPGPKAGHVVEASSYFDRLWKREDLAERYFIVLRKT